MNHESQTRLTYHVGHNYAGYLPESDVACFSEWQPAADHLTATMREYADEDDDLALEAATPETTGYATEDEWARSDDYPTMRALVDAILTDDPPAENEEFSVTVEAYDHRRVAFWLMRVLGCECDDTQ